MRTAIPMVFAVLQLLAIAGCGGGGGGGNGTAATPPPGRAIAGSGSESGFALSGTTDGGYIIAGTVSPGGLGGTDAYLVKVDATGIVVWSKSYGGSGDDKGYFVVQTTPDGGYVMAGETASAIGGGPGIYLAKIDLTGTLEWENTYAGIVSNKHSEGTVVRQTNDGGYMVVGFHELSTSLAVKLASNGVVEWVQTFGLLTGPIYSVQRTTDGGYIYIGRYDTGGASCAALLVKVNS